MTPEERLEVIERYLAWQYAVATFEAEYAWYLYRAFTGHVGQQVWTVRPNGEVS